ncbi:SEN34 subunit of tRNA-splicing endonuclease [Xylariaceae sp. FL1651]|nr:SEN34 subunit of tRNA-splicing endonuclease [Xylariaceae sp. FL1651]
MASASPPNRPMLRITKVGGRYLLFDIDDVMYLRRNYNICSVFIGTIPQNPQQNVFMGLPLELMPEEAQVLVRKKVAYIADDATFHPSRLAVVDQASRQAYLQSLKNQGKRLQMAAIESSKRNMPKTHQGKAKKKEPKEPEDSFTANLPERGNEAEESISLFDSAPTRRRPVSQSPDEVEGYALTPTTSKFLLTPSESEPEPPISVDVPVSYPLFAHLHDKGYYMMPGIRFGCDYNVYPGDPLRFHSHFVAVHFSWDEEITMMDLVAGGRLATSVKKGYLFGGAVADGSCAKTKDDGHDASQEENGDKSSLNSHLVAPPARAFCLEWAGM